MNQGRSIINIQNNGGKEVGCCATCGCLVFALAVLAVIVQVLGLGG